MVYSIEKGNISNDTIFHRFAKKSDESKILAKSTLTSSINSDDMF